AMTVSPKASGWIPLSGFTMAEILLSLTIIGVVAAITLPSLTGNINERTWNTQRKALYARFSQAISLMPALNGYGTITEDASGSVIEDNVAETFITAGLSKVLKINNICDSDHLADCGIPSKVNPLLGGSVVDFPTDWYTLEPKMLAAGLEFNGSASQLVSQINAKAAAFETANGESIAVFYNNACRFNMDEDSYFVASGRVCANFIFDLNGTKGPNTVGKDIGFMSVLYPTDTVVVMPNPAPNSAATAKDFESARKYCNSLDDYRMPNLEELMALFVNNKKLIGVPEQNYWSSKISAKRTNYAYYLWFANGTINVMNKDKAESFSTMCVKR
ncbi:MAG: prepilin-type N-terminal cleavage/methylation domain-containing protein, partial [Fusobacterium sp.]|nr:prepilin-type N-terminal cleavage/methylation domain-containing protein [Fusobacterium sp.]